MKMQIRLSVLAGALAALAATAAEAGWRNVDESHHLAGRKASEGYLLGKVVLVDRWGVRCPPCRALLPRMEQVWQSFKTKPFVLLGGHCAGWGTPDQVKALVAENKLTYPIYEDAGLAEGEPNFNAIPFLYVTDPTGRVVYYGHDERAATEAIVTALTDWETPRNVDQWKRFLDFELKNLPAHAYLRLGDFRKKFPSEYAAYAEQVKALKALADVKPVSELVAFAKKAKDARAFEKKQKVQKDKFKRLVQDTLRKNLKLKDTADPRLAQEAKNALADLKWTLAAL